MIGEQNNISGLTIATHTTVKATNFIDFATKVFMLVAEVHFANERPHLFFSFMFVKSLTNFFPFYD